MTDHEIRLFASPAAVARVGEGLLACSLPKAEWTHEAHLAATAYLVVAHPKIELDTALPGLIRAYNESVGGVNDETQGYHDTITRAYLNGVRLFLRDADRTAPIHGLVNDLLRSPMGRRDWPLRFWSKARLLSVEARRGWVAPDLADMPDCQVVPPDEAANLPKVRSNEHETARAGNALSQGCERTE